MVTERQGGAATYKILRRLGKGGMAEVFLARHEGLAGFKRLAVVKRLLPQFSQAKNIADMLIDEATIAAQLNHPNIVQIYELGQEDDQYFIVMEYVDGCDLATLARIERRRQSRVPVRLALRVVSEAAMGLDYAHRQVGLDGRPMNLVHRDVSPHNVLCSREGAVKVGDFGIVKAVGKLQVTDVGVVKGKVQYMAPEQYTGGDVDGRADIFSLGVVLYQLTVGRLPRVSKDGAVAMRRVIDGEIPRPTAIKPDYPEELEAIVMRALQHKSCDRYEAAAEFRDELLDFARHNDLLAFPKELGDYVNQLVPPQPLTGENAGPDKPSTVIISKTMRAGAAREDEGTRPPAGTEVVARQTKAVEPASVDEDQEADTDERAVLSNEHLTPLPGSATDLSVEEVGASVRGAAREAREAGRDRGKERPSSKGDERGARKDKDAGHQDAGHQDAGHQDAASRGEGGRASAGDAASSSAAAGDDRGDGQRAATQPAKRRAGGGGAERPDGRRREPTPSVPTSTTARRGGGLGLALGAIVLSAAVVVYVLVFHRNTPPPRPAGGHGAAIGSGAVEVSSQPTKAAVSIDGAERCAATPCRIGGLPLGRELLVTVRAAGHSLWMQRLVLTRTEPKLLLSARLTPEAPGAARRAKRRRGRPGAKVARRRSKSVNAGVSRKVSAKAGAKPAGKASRRGRKGGRVTVVPSGDPKTAVLVIDVRPAWAEVWVEGQKVGVTPMQRQIRPGNYTIELKNPTLNYHRVFKISSELGKKVKISDSVAAPPGKAPPGKAPPGKAPPGKAPPGKAPPGKAPPAKKPS